MNILITGATGNIGQEVIRYLFQHDTKYHIIAGVRNIEKARLLFSKYPQLDFVNFDFELKSTFAPALDKVDSIFILRPPHISDITKYFLPFIAQLQNSSVKQVLFLSVQGVETSRFIPHHKIENLIVASGLDYIFLRPSYFMQNLTTTLIGDIQNARKVWLPAGQAKFNWVDIENLGEAIAILLENFPRYKNNAFEITGTENLNFGSVISQINTVIKNKIKYIDANPFQYYFIKRREGYSRGLILVMILLHYLPRFQKEPKISEFFENLTGKKPTRLSEFIVREKHKLES